MLVDQMGSHVKNVYQSEGILTAQSIICSSKILQDDLESIGLRIKQCEDNIKSLRVQKNKLDGFILDMQVILGMYHSSSVPMVEMENPRRHQREEETTDQILRHENSAASIYCQLKTRHDTQASSLTLVNDVLGIVATLGKVDDDNLSRLLSEYLGVQNMLAIVCKTYEGIKALETYDKEGYINRCSGLHGLGASIGRPLDGQFLVICLESLRPYVGKVLADDPQRRLNLIKPTLPNAEHPCGFLGFAVNMINTECMNSFSFTASGYGLRETLFYTLFSRLQVYETRADMLLGLPCISDGALSLDGGMIKSTGVFSLGNRENVDVRFSKSSASSSPSTKYLETENQIRLMKFRREKLLEEMQKEQQLLEYTKQSFEHKKQEFIKFLAESSS